MVRELENGNIFCRVGLHCQRIIISLLPPVLSSRNENYVPTLKEMRKLRQLSSTEAARRNPPCSPEVLIQRVGHY